MRPKKKACACKTSPPCRVHWAWRRGMGARSSLCAAHAEFIPEALIQECVLWDPFLWPHCSEFAKKFTICSSCDLTSHRAERTVLTLKPHPCKGVHSCSISGREQLLFCSCSVSFPGETSESASEDGFQDPGSAGVSS